MLSTGNHLQHNVAVDCRCPGLAKYLLHLCNIPDCSEFDDLSQLPAITVSWICRTWIAAGGQRSERISLSQGPSKDKWPDCGFVPGFKLTSTFAILSQWTWSSQGYRRENNIISRRVQRKGYHSEYHVNQRMTTNKSTDTNSLAKFKARVKFDANWVELHWFWGVYHFARRPSFYLTESTGRWQPPWIRLISTHRL